MVLPLIGLVSWKRWKPRKNLRIIVRSSRVPIVDAESHPAFGITMEANPVHLQVSTVTVQ